MHKADHLESVLTHRLTARALFVVFKMIHFIIRQQRQCRVHQLQARIHKLRVSEKARHHSVHHFLQWLICNQIVIGQIW